MIIAFEPTNSMKMAAILTTILNFVYLLVLECLDNHLDSLLPPWNTCLETYVCI